MPAQHCGPNGVGCAALAHWMSQARWNATMSFDNEKGKRHMSDACSQFRWKRTQSSQQDTKTADIEAELRLMGRTSEIRIEM
eukprot:3412296-Pyramimonas_sp.AAC.1